jgi:nitroreductase
MDTIQAITERRAVKHFDPDHVMPGDTKNKLLELTLLAPTAFNIQNWRLVVVEDKELRKQIRAVSWDQAQVTDASLLVVFCADLNSWARQPERYWSHAPEQVQNILVPAIGNYYSGKKDVQRDEAMRSCGLAAQTLMLAAKSLGYDSCPMDGFDFEAVAKLIKLPEDHIISMFVVVGKGTKEAWERGGKIDMSEAIKTDTF